MQQVLLVAGAIAGLVAFAEAIRRYVIRPIQRGVKGTQRLVDRVEAAAGFAQELMALSGSVTQLAIATDARIKSVEETQAELGARINETALIALDNEVAIRRMQKAG